MQSHSLSSGQKVGDYELLAFVEETGLAEIWLARQVSVARDVLLEFSSGEDEASFAADMQARAAVEHAAWSSVYEGIDFEERLGFACELLPERSLTSLIESNKRIEPPRICKIVTQIAGAFAELRGAEIACGILRPDDVRVGELGLVRLRNRVHAGNYSSSEDWQSRQCLAVALRSLLQKDLPGATRSMTLLNYIDGQGGEHCVAWSDIQKLASEIEKQLTGRTLPTPAEAPEPQKSPVRVAKPKFKRHWLAGAGLFLIVFLALVFWPQKASPIETDVLALIEGGSCVGPDGDSFTYSRFEIDAQEVTIGEYAKFLQAYLEMSAEERHEFQLAEQPLEKTNYRPNHWRRLLSKAKAGESWRGQVVTLEHPVRGVDWWDAAAYAKWKGGRLPTEQEWWAAARKASRSQNRSKAWLPVSRASDAPVDMDGGLAEWLWDSSENPALPMETAKPVVAGASFLSNREWAQTREWLPSRLERREDIGFRVVYAEPPAE